MWYSLNARHILAEELVLRPNGGQVGHLLAQSTEDKIPLLLLMLAERHSTWSYRSIAEIIEQIPRSKPVPKSLKFIKKLQNTRPPKAIYVKSSDVKEFKTEYKHILKNLYTALKMPPQLTEAVKKTPEIAHPFCPRH